MKMKLTIYEAPWGHREITDPQVILKTVNDALEASHQQRAHRLKKLKDRDRKTDAAGSRR